MNWEHDYVSMSGDPFWKFRWIPPHTRVSGHAPCITNHINHRTIAGSGSVDSIGHSRMNWETGLCKHGRTPHLEIQLKTTTHPSVRPCHSSVQAHGQNQCSDGSP